MSIAIKAEGLTKKFGAFTAVDAVDLKIEAGKIFGIVGPNGSIWVEIACNILTQLLPALRKNAGTVDSTICGEAICALVRQQTATVSLLGFACE
jgi:ABC-type branched-subunit amino acid transport system ATPase component